MGTRSHIYAAGYDPTRIGSREAHSRTEREKPNLDALERKGREERGGG
jgi:hypothetical protein